MCGGRRTRVMQEKDREPARFRKLKKAGLSGRRQDWSREARED